MTRTLLFSLLLISTLFSYSQKRWNLLTGMNLSSFSHDVMEEYGFEDYRDAYIGLGGSATSRAKNALKLNGFIGVELDMFLSDKTFIKTGIKYLSTGDRFYFDTNDIQYQSNFGSTDDASYEMRPRIDYLVVPVSVGLKASDLVSLYVGVSPAFATRNIYRLNYFTGNGDNVKEKWDAEDSFFDARELNVFGQFGMSFYFADGVSVLDVRVSRSLFTTYDVPSSEFLENIYDAKTWNFEIGMGVYFLRGFY